MSFFLPVFPSGTADRALSDLNSERTLTGAACLLESTFPKPPFSAFLARETTRQRRWEGREIRGDDFIIIDGNDGNSAGEEVEQPLLPLFLLAAAAVAGAARRTAAQTDIVILSLSLPRILRTEGSRLEEFEARESED